MKYFIPLILTIVCCTDAQTEISADRLLMHMEVLAHDSLEGRAIGTRGIETAAAYIAGEFRRYGIQQMPSLGSYFQTFPVHGSTPIERTVLTFYAPRDAFYPKLFDDYLLYSAGAQTFIPYPVPLVFAGYGIVAPEYAYDDYNTLDVENAIVVFLSGEPASDDPLFFAGEQPTIHSSVPLKQKIALARGARGTILLPNPRDVRMNDWYEQQRQFMFEEARLPYVPTENLNILLNPKLGFLLFQSTAYSIDDIEMMDRNGTMKRFPLELRGSFQGYFRERDFLASNVIGMIEGSDPSLRDTYVLVTAHYDHLGIGRAVDGDSIYNGLFDNASGVAAVLELARVISELPVPPERSIVFALLTGEERGFLGSQYYCLNAPVPLYRTIANVNIDGVALFERFRSVVGVGQELSTLDRHLRSVANVLGLRIDEMPTEFHELQPFNNSDQFIFAQAGIPSILVAEGLQYETTPYEEGVERFVSWGRDVYHSPSDDLAQTVSYSAAQQHTILLYHFIIHLAASRTEPEWNDGVPFKHAREQSIKQKQ
jgi:hypothetical protein